MELLLNNNLINTISNKIGELQENFLKSNWGKAINNAVDLGLKAIFPDFIEDEVIDIKNAFVKEGLIEGIKTAVEVSVNKGKEIIGMFNGNLENMTQAEAIMKNGDLIGNIAKLLEEVIDKCMKNGLLKESLGNLIKSGKDSMLDYAKKNIDKINKDQTQKIKEMDEYIQDWSEAFKNKDFKKMQNAYIKINHRMESTFPIKETLDKAEEVENLHNLIKNNGKNFDLTEEQLELAQRLIS